MNCECVDRLLGVYGELDRAERRAVSEHLRGCEACRAAWRDEQRVRAHVGALPVLDPPRRLQAELLDIPRLARPVVPWSLPGPAALLILALGAITLLGPALSGRAPAPTPDAQPRGQSVARSGQPGQPAPVGRLERIALVTPSAGPEGPAAAPTEGARAADPQPARLVARPTRPTVPPAGVEAPPLPPRDPEPPPQHPSDPNGHANGHPGSGSSSPSPSPVPPSPGPSATTPPPVACVALVAEVFADLAGDGPLECSGCDGRWDAEDEALAAALGVVLPPFQLVVYDGAGTVWLELPVEPDGARAAVSMPEVCGQLPLTVEVDGGPRDWAACPGSGGLERSVNHGGAAEVSFPLTLGCPVGTPTPIPSGTPSDTTTATPTATPSPPPTTMPVEVTPVRTETPTPTPGAWLSGRVTG